MIGWIPFASLYLLFTGQFRYLLEALAAGTTVVFTILIFPFGWKPLLMHLQLPNDYIVHAERIWNENPEYFYNSLGMAKFFGPQHVNLLHSILLWGTFIIPLFFLVFIKKKSAAPKIILLSCFQFCITFFFNFLDISYLYLFYTPVFVSLVIAGWALTANEDLQIKSAMK
jgi:hypothetical protein